MTAELLPSPRASVKRIDGETAERFLDGLARLYHLVLITDRSGHVRWMSRSTCSAPTASTSGATASPDLAGDQARRPALRRSCAARLSGGCANPDLPPGRRAGDPRALRAPALGPPGRGGPLRRDRARRGSARIDRTEPAARRGLRSRPAGGLARRGRRGRRAGHPALRESRGRAPGRPHTRGAGRPSRRAAVLGCEGSRRRGLVAGVAGRRRPVGSHPASARRQQARGLRRPPVPPERVSARHAVSLRDAPRRGSPT
jgi:hypothetical protein